MSRRALLALPATGALVAAAAVARVMPGTGDYGHTHTGPFDDAGPAINALLEGRFGEVADVQPLMGLVSIVWRLPFAAIGNGLDGVLGEYRLGAFACLWALTTLAAGVVWTHWHAATERRLAAVTAALVVGLLAFGPATTDALEAGHPEELLLAALGVAGVWAVASGRITAGAVLIGLAIGTKPFGLLAWLAALLAVPAAAARLTAVAAGVAAACVLPLPLLAPDVPLDLARDLSDYRRIYPQSLWWVAGHDQVLVAGFGDSVRLMPDGLARGTGTLAAALLAVVAATVVWRHGRGAALGHDALALGAGLFLGRAALDPLNLEYYALPGLAFLIAWEVLARQRPPILGGTLVATSALVFEPSLERTLAAGLFAVWALGPIAYGLRQAARSPG